MMLWSAHEAASSNSDKYAQSSGRNPSGQYMMLSTNFRKVGHAFSTPCKVAEQALDAVSRFWHPGLPVDLHHAR